MDCNNVISGKFILKYKRNMKRIYYLDLIRVLLTIVVFYHHSAIAFGASGGWYYIAKETTSGLTQWLLSANMAVEQSYFMSLFFFISAYFLPISLERKGTKGYISDRLNRLGIPLLLFYFVLNPLLVYWIYGSSYEPGFGPMWFVFTLLIFESTYVAYRSLCKRRIVIKWKGYNWTGALVFIVFTGLLAFCVRLSIPVGSDVLGLQLGFFPLYISMYLLGIVAYRNQWLKRLKIRDAHIWIALILLIGIPSLLFMIAKTNRIEDFFGGWNISALLYAMWEPVMCVGMSYVLLACSDRYFNRPYSWVQLLSRNSYAFYIIHPFVVVGCVFGVELLSVSPLTGLALVCCVGIPLCFILATGFRRMMDLIHVKV